MIKAAMQYECRPHTGRILVMLTPGGHEDFLKELSLSVQQFGKDPVMMKEVAKKHAVTIRYSLSARTKLV